MRGLKTAVRIWKKELEFKAITWGISPEHRKNYRRMRQDSIRALRLALVNDLLDRHRVGDMQLFKEDLEALQRLRRVPIMAEIEAIYKKYL